MNETIKSIKCRRSIRNYQTAEIPEDVLEELIDCARLAPTARNTQPWEFIIIKDKDTLDNIGRLASHGPFIKDAAACIIVCSDDYDYFLEDCSAATENILVAAQSLGIGSCWVAGHGKKYAEQIKEMLNIPKDIHVVSLIPLGYPGNNAPGVKKRELNDVIHWNHF